MTISRDEARAQGLRRYFTGAPCARGHLSERYVSNTHCVECRRTADPVQFQRYYAKNKERLNAVSRAYYANLSPKEKEDARARWREQRRTYTKTHRPSGSSKHYRDRPDLYLAYCHARNARKRASGGSFRPEDIQRIRRNQGDRCAVCRVNLYGGGEIDHDMPLKLGGSNNPDNLQLLCRPCNRQKGSKHPIAFAESLADQLGVDMIDWANIEHIQIEGPDF